MRVTPRGAQKGGPRQVLRSTSLKTHHCKEHCDFKIETEMRVESRGPDWTSRPMKE